MASSPPGAQPHPAWERRGPEGPRPAAVGGGQSQPGCQGLLEATGLEGELDRGVRNWPHPCNARCRLGRKWAETQSPG